MEKKKIILPSKRFFKSSEEDVDIKIGIENNEILLRENDKNIVLDIAQQFDKERNESKSYKIYGKLKMIFRNLYSGTSDNYIYLRDRLYLLGDGTNNNFTGYIPYNEFAFLRNDVLRQVNSPSTGSTLVDFTQNITLTTGTTGHTTITEMSAPYQNWNMYLTYVFSGDTEYPMVYTLTGDTAIYTFNSGDGIPFRVELIDNYYVLSSPIEHGMNEGEYVTLSGGTLTNLIPVSGRTFHIDSIGNQVYRSERFVINILKSQIPSGTTIDGTVLIGKRCLDIRNISGTTSQYYVHKHKTLTSVDEYIIDKAGFESPIWNDEKKIIFENFSGDNDIIVEGNRMESLLFDFKTPFELDKITNNLGYTPTEVYLTVIFRNGNGFFNYPPKVGYKFNFHNTWVDQSFYGETSNETGLSGETFTRSSITFTSGKTIPIGTVLTGAFVEYNDFEFKERIISESYHKFTSPPIIFNHQQDNSGFYSGVSQDNMVGLFYQPHYRVKLRELSPYVETSKTNDVYNLPENVKYDDNQKIWKWRDLYDHGYVDPDGYGTDFPFVNGMHYVRKNINFYLMNEKDYTNKTDGITSFTTTKDSSGNPKNNIDC